MKTEKVRRDHVLCAICLSPLKEGDIYYYPGDPETNDPAYAETSCCGSTSVILVPPGTTDQHEVDLLLKGNKKNPEVIDNL